MSFLIIVFISHMQAASAQSIFFIAAHRSTSTYIDKLHGKGRRPCDQHFRERTITILKFAILKRWLFILKFKVSFFNQSRSLQDTKANMLTERGFNYYWHVRWDFLGKFVKKLLYGNEKEIKAAASGWRDLKLIRTTVSDAIFSLCVLPEEKLITFSLINQHH